MKVLAPAVLISSILFFFGPFTIYSGNVSEFQVSLADILKHYAVPGTVLVGLLLVIGLLLPARIVSFFASVLIGLGVLLWVQGNFFAWTGGPIGITDIDWEEHAWRVWVDGIIWFAVLGLACFYHRKLYKISALISAILISIQIVYLVLLSFQSPQVWKGNPNSSAPVSPPEKIFQFSSKSNIIHIILDEFQSTVFKDIVDENPEHYEKALGGFTFFQDTTGEFPTTIMSIPAILGGGIYNNNVPILSFIESAYKSRTISNALAAKGYEVDFAAPFGWPRWGEHSICYPIAVPYGVSKEQHDKASATLIFNLVLFRYAPHFLKKAALNNQIRLPTVDITKEGIEYQQGARHFAHKAFLQDLIDRMSLDRDRPVYKFIHLTTTHWPAVLNPDCEYAGEILPWTWKNVRVQAKCGFDHFVEFLNRLKALGIYDSSFIILQADHGYWKVPDSAKQITITNDDIPLDGYFTDDKEYFAQIVCSALPLLAVKLPHSKGLLTVSEAEVMLSDIPATVSSVLNLDEEFNGRSVFDVSPKESREREFRYYDTLNSPGDEYFGRMDKFVINGSVFDKGSWRFIKYLSPTQSQPVDRIDFGTNGVSRFLGDGWGGNHGGNDGLTFQWALGRSASVLLSLEKDAPIRLTANVKTFVKDQQVTVKVDGQEVGTWHVSHDWNWEKHSVCIDASKNRPEVSVVEFKFSQVKKPGGKDPRPLAVLFESITLEKLGSSK
jgi:hypothetical protein